MLSGALSGYNLGLGPPDVQPGGGRPLGERADEGEPSADGALFVDDSITDAGQGWRGAVSTEELPGGGLHRHVRGEAVGWGWFSRQTAALCRS